MDRKAYTLILGVVLAGGFFLPYFNNFFGQDVSGYELVFSGGDDWRRFILLLIPVSGLLLILGALNKGNYIPGRGLLCWLPLLTLLYIIIIDPLTEGAAIGDVLKTIGKGYGIGMWLTIAASLLLAFYSPRSKA